MKAISKYSWAIFLVSFSTLLFELSLTRVFSVTLWYHFGFLIISTALLGFGISGVLLSIWRKLRQDYSLDKSLGWISVCLSLSVIICFWLLQKIPFDPFSLYTDKMQLLYMPLTYMLVSVPFFFGGLALSLLFTRFPNHINRLYAFDLAGAALGCIAIIFTMSIFGGGGSVLLASTVAGIAAMVLFGKSYKIGLGISVVVFFSSLALSLDADRMIPLRITDNKTRGQEIPKSVFSKWNTFSKIDLIIFPSYYSPEKKAPQFVIDYGTAATGLDFDLKPNVRTSLQKFPGDSIYGSCLAYLDKKDPTVLIIGSGCGSQVLDALHFGAKRITAVDINPIINSVVQTNENWADLFHQPEVKLVTDEGRNFVRSTKEKYDAIISVHTISNSAIASGALSLSENYVLTKEAFEDYYDHLTDNGMIFFTRPEFQLARLFSTGREVLESRGITDPASHFFAFTFKSPPRSGRKAFYSVFVMSKRPMSRELVDRMNTFIYIAKEDQPVMLYDGVRQYSNIYDSILRSADLKNLYKLYPFEISPSTDNEPFFNHHSRWSSLNGKSFTDIFSQERMGRMALEDKPIAEVSLLVLLAQVLLIAAIFILLPLWKYAGNGIKRQSILPNLVYFSGLGCGFIMIEIVMIQMFSLLLGEPVYTFAIVLAALLLFTGLGAYLSGRFPIPEKNIRVAVTALAALLLLASFFLPSLLRTATALPMAGRVILSIVLIFPFGLLLGTPFPSGIRIIEKQSPALIPWAWGVNGFFTVVGSVLALILSMMIGFQAVIWIAVGIYLMSMWVMVSSQTKTAA